MNRHNIIDTIGSCYLTANIENDEYSYVNAAGGRAELEKLLGHEISHEKADIRLSNGDVVILIETKPKFTKKDEEQLAAYLENEIAVHGTEKVICILANILNDDIKVWKFAVDDENLLKHEATLKNFEYYANLFKVNKQNDREKVLKNTYALNELLHKVNIQENLRSQFVGTTLLYIKEKVRQSGASVIDEQLKLKLNRSWNDLADPDLVRSAIKSTLNKLLDGSENKTKKIELLQKNVLDNQNVRNLNLTQWIKILDTILLNIYKYININTSEGQDILNLFFIAFNKYTGKADKNQAFTPDHITDFMCRLTGVNRKSIVMDITCGSGSFLVQAMMKALADCKDDEQLKDHVKKHQIFGIENEEKAYGLATTNMLIHGDGNSNIKFDSCFKCEKFILEARPDIILMNPPYNAKPMGVPEAYKATWGSAKDGKEDPTKGLVFIQFLSDVVRKMGKEVKLAVLLPVSAAIGTSKIIAEVKGYMLRYNTLEAVFTLPNEIFYPGASVNACCMLFTLGKSHFDSEGKPNKKTFFGYCKDDGFKKKKNLGRVEQFDAENKSKWKAIRKNWLELFNNREVVDGLSATEYVTGNDEWLCEAYMKTDYSKLTEADFQQTINNYLAYLVKFGKYPNLNYKQSTAPALNVDGWKEFKVENILKCSTTKLSIKDELSEGNVPFISRSAENNGCDGYVETDSSKVTKGNCITIGAEGIYAFYQPENFATGNKIYSLKIKNLNVYIAMFLCTVLNQEDYRYSYGRARILSKIEEEIIKLPVDEEGRPDWQFMENYIKSLPYGDRL